jgi:signal transduction histidine kinase
MAVVGHDLRTPLTSIRMSAEALASAGLDPRQQARVQRILSSADRMTDMIRDLLDFSRARRGLGIVLGSDRVCLGEVCRGAVEEVRQAHAGREVALSVAEDTWLDGDRSRLGQVVSNLLVNAVQHGAPGERIEVDVSATPAAVTVRVHNQGPPIPEAALPRVFEPFRRGDADAQPRSGRNLGLGLFIVREIVRAHGGAVEVRSRAGDGTTFTVRLPRASAGVSSAELAP